MEKEMKQEELTLGQISLMLKQQMQQMEQNARQMDLILDSLNRQEERMKKNEDQMKANEEHQQKRFEDVGAAIHEAAQKSEQATSDLMDDVKHQGLAVKDLDNRFSAVQEANAERMTRIELRLDSRSAECSPPDSPPVEPIGSSDFEPDVLEQQPPPAKVKLKMDASRKSRRSSSAFKANADDRPAQSSSCC